MGWQRLSFWLVAGLVAAEGVLVAIGNSFAFLLPLLVLSGVLLLSAPDPPLALGCLGLLTVSWDRVSVRLGGLTLKPAYVAFALALALDLLARSRTRAKLSQRTPRLMLMQRTVGLFIGLMVLATLRSGHLGAGARQLLVIGLGAIVPAIACFRLSRIAARRQKLMKWALGGAGLAAALAIYQFTAAYLRLPSVLAYQGSVAGLGRTAGFSYEPAYFAMYLASFLPLVTVLLLARHGESPGGLHGARALFVLLSIGLLVSNARAGYLVLPLAVIIPLAARSSPRPVRARPVITLAGAMCIVLVLATTVGFDVPTFVRDRLASVADTREPSSNAPRLRLYTVERRIARDHLALGIGPGTLGDILPGYGLTVAEYFQGAPASDLARVVANNIWLQAVLDCGIGGLLGIAVVLAVLLRLSARSRDQYGRWLAFGSLLGLLVGGALTSVFWDVRYWSLIGIALAADASMLRRAPDQVST